jgi:cutinase
MSRHGAYHGRLLVSLQHSTSAPRLTTTFSQGGQLVHNAADMLSAQDSAFVQASVIFGDPNNGSPVGKVSAAQTKVICHTGDLICAHQAVILAPHLTVRFPRPKIMLYNANFCLQYGADATTAASFVMSKVGGAAKKATRQIPGTKAEFYVS